MYLKYLENQLQRGKISRREFLGRATAIGLTLPAAMSLASKAGEAAEPKKGGTLHAGLGHGSTTDSIDPATFENGFTQFTGYGYRNNLTEIDSTGELIGELAEGAGHRVEESILVIEQVLVDFAHGIAGAEILAPAAD